MLTRLASFLLLLTFVITPAWAQKPTTNSTTITYACETADGRKLVSDRPIRECLYREQRVLGLSGATLSVIPPQLTPQQRAAQEAERRQQDAARQAQERADASARSLLVRYPSPASHDKARAEQLQPLTERLRVAQEEMVVLEDTRRTLQQEMRPYSSPADAPMQLRERYEFNQRDISIQQRIINNLGTQIENTNSQFDQEHQLLTPYWQQRSSANGTGR